MPGDSNPKQSNGDSAHPEETIRTPDISGSTRLLQLTDLHLFAIPDAQLLGLTTRRSFEAVLGLAISRSMPDDTLVLTGDLVHDGSAEGYRALRRALDATGLLYYCIPGNHDSRSVMQQCLGSASLAPVSIRRLGVWNLVFLDSTLPGHDSGYLGPAQLASLESALTADHAPTLIFLHQHPVPIQSVWMDTMAVADGDALITACDRHLHVKALVCGHIHQDFARQRGGYRILGTPSTCVQFMPGSTDFAIDERPPGYREFQLYADGQFETRVVRLDDYEEQASPSSIGY
jgi:3',5'-cyclic-AMP phosphodiesterase